MASMACFSYFRRTLFIVAALATIGTFILPVPWVRFTVFGRPSDLTYRAAIEQLLTHGEPAASMLRVFIGFAVAFSLGAMLILAGHPIKGSFMNVLLLFSMADRRILTPFPGNRNLITIDISYVCIMYCRRADLVRHGIRCDRRSGLLCSGV